MLKNYLKIAFRNLFKHKGYSFINITGLAIGIACCVVIYLYITDELGYDKYHSNLDRIYRVAGKYQSKTSSSASATICAPVGQVLQDNFPQVEKVAQVLPVSSGLVKYQENMFYEGNRMYANTELFSVLTIPFLKGDPTTALDRPATIVISERMAKKYFGTEEPIGKTVSINSREYEITGIAANSPVNTHFKYDFILSLKTLEGRYPFSMWFLANLYTYVKLKPNINIAAFSEQLAQVAETHAKQDLEEGDVITYFIQPVADIHLYSHLRNEKEPSVNPIYLYIFSAVGALILLIASVNFMNLTTARSANRAKEVGMRKVVGAQRRQLIEQFLGESIILSIFALFVAFIMVYLSMPLFNSLTGKEFTFVHLIQPAILFIFVGLALFVGIISGSYPAFFLSAFKPIKTLKSSVSRLSGGAGLRKFLVAGQFTIAIILMIGTLVVFQQLDFMKNQPLGFDKQQKLIIPIRGALSIEDNYAFVKNEFLQHSSISGVTVFSNVFGRSIDRWDTKLVGGADERYHPINYLYADDDFISEYDIKMLAGRQFDNNLSTDINGAFIINMSTVKEFGWSTPTEAIGKRMQGIGDPAVIIGVIEDFHYRGLQSVIEPLILHFRPSRFSNISLTVNTENLNETISFVKEKWQELFAGNPFEYSFLDEDFDRQYRAEDQFGKLFSSLTFLGLFIACLGLLGLASFTAEQRTKEIGIRKALGASVTSIIALLTSEFVKWVGMGTIIAWPVAFYVMQNWLTNFAYRISLGWLPFVAAILATFIAMLTVSYQAIKAATANPVDALKYE